MFKKISLALMSSVAVLLMANGFAEVPAEPCDEKPDVCCKEPAPGPFAFSYARELSLSCPKDFYFDAQYLFMQTKEEGLELGVSQKDSTDEYDFPLTEGDVLGFSTGSSKWNWNNGFRLGFGGYFGHDVWGLQAQYTYLRIKDDHGLNATGKVLLPFWINNSAGQAIYHNITMRWTGNINVFDLMLNKPYHVSRYLALNPEVGLRAGWIEQDFLIRHSRRDYTYTGEMKGDQDFWGIGMRAKLGSEWILDSHFSVFGHVAGSMLYSHFDVSQTGTTPETNQANYETKNDFYTNTINTEIGLGLAYGVFFNEKKDHLAIKLAYEFHEWFSFNRLRRFTAYTNVAYNDESRGALMYNGLSFQIAFNF